MPPETQATTTTTPPPAQTAATTAPAQTAAGTGTQGTGATATPPANWYDGAPADTVGWIQNKGYKSPLDAVDSARNLEKLMGAPQDRILKLAEKMRDDAGKLTPEAKAIFERLGSPKDAKDYQIDIPKENGDATLAEMMRGVFHEEGISKTSAERIVKDWNAYQAKIIGGMKEQAELNFKNQEQSLRKEWGQAYDQNVNIARDAVRTLGVGEKEIMALTSALGHDKAMKVFQKIGSAVGEGRFVQGGAANSVMEPAQAQYQIKELMKDRDFYQRLAKGDADANARWQKLHQMAFPGETQVQSLVVQ